MIALFIYGTELHCVRMGFAGIRPLIYAVYAYNCEDELPVVPGQTYRTITKEQYEWLKNHLHCDVSWIVAGPNGWYAGNLECRTHGLHFKLFTEEPIQTDLWEERKI